MCVACTLSSLSDDDPAEQHPDTHTPSGPVSSERTLRIAVVGVCGAGKTTLATGLSEKGYHARQISQEHSAVTYLWRRFWEPDLLVYLEASDEVVRTRLGDAGTRATLRRQRQRLAIARRECDIFVDTDPLSPSEVLETVLSQLP